VLQAQPHSLLDGNGALDRAVVQAAIEERAQRLVYVSCAAVFERAERFPTPEEHLPDCPLPRSALARAKLAGEALCRAAGEQHGLPFTICRPAAVYGPGQLPGEQRGWGRTVVELIDGALSRERPLQVTGPGERTLAPTHVEDVAEGIVATMRSDGAADEDFNLGLASELSVEELARLVWRVCTEEEGEPELEHVPAPEPLARRCWPAAEKARRVLGWEARIGPGEGIAQTAAWLRGLRVSDGL